MNPAAQSKRMTTQATVPTSIGQAGMPTTADIRAIGSGVLQRVAAP